jgi:ankyrin repeat protein
MKTVRDNAEVTKISMEKLESELQHEKVRQWLVPPDPSVNHNKALKQRHEGSGIWLLEGDQFLKWKTQPKSFLWLHGIPGCGKTILSSTVIQHLNSLLSHQPLLYFYFDFTDSMKQTLDSLLRSLIYQLYYKHDSSHALLNSLFSSCEDGRRQPTCESLYNLLSRILEQIREAWIVIDALDECSTRRGSLNDGVLLWIRDLLSLKQTNIHLLVTSRPEQDILSGFSDLAHSNNIIHLQSTLIMDDIHAYIRSRVREDAGLSRWRSHLDIQNKIETTLVKKADGMSVRISLARLMKYTLILGRFRWVSCQLDSLEQCIDPRGLQNALKTLPKTLDETYSRILQSIPQEYKQNAIRILQLLTFSERPITIEEATDAIALDIECEPHFDPMYRMPNPSEITRYCSSLVVIVTAKNDVHKQSGKNRSVSDNQVLQLAHYSVKEYLQSDRVDGSIVQHFQEINARAALSSICLIYLLQLDGSLRKEETESTFPLARYSAQYWMTHAVIAEEIALVQDLIKKFFLNNKQDSYRATDKLYRPDNPWWESDKELRDPCPPLYYASYGGLTCTVEWLLSHGADTNTQDGYYGNALQVASYKGHEQIVRLLLNHGANVNAQGGHYGNALYAASSKGHEQIVRLLLNHGADVNAQGGHYGNALQAASYKGHEQIVRLLLNHGADVNAQGGHYGNALQVASYKGHEQIIRLLLNHGADVNAQGGYYGNALQVASYRGHEQIVRLLLDQGADINAQGGQYGNALQAASSEGHEQIVQLLLDQGADINTHGGYYGNALQVASYIGHEQIVRLLLDQGADINAQGGQYSNALQAASYKGHEQIVRLLLDQGADINAQGGQYGNALHAASSEGHEQIVRLLLENGAESQR